jgi:hypothetical protein
MMMTEHSAMVKTPPTRKIFIVIILVWCLVRFRLECSPVVGQKSIWEGLRFDTGCVKTAALGLSCDGEFLPSQLPLLGL